MDSVSYVRFILALVFVLGLAWLAAYAARRFLPGQALPRNRASRKLQVLESMALDQRTRLLLVRCGATQHLLTLGPQGVTTVASNMNAEDIALGDEPPYEELLLEEEVEALQQEDKAA